MANEGIWPFEASAGTPLSQVRLLMQDVNPVRIDDTDTGTYIFASDAEIEALLPLFDDDPKRVAIQVLSQGLIAYAMGVGSWSTEDLSVRGDLIAAAAEKTLARLSGDLSSDDDFFAIVGGYDVSGHWPHHVEGAIDWRLF